MEIPTTLPLAFLFPSPQISLIKVEYHDTWTKISLLLFFCLLHGKAVSNTSWGHKTLQSRTQPTQAVPDLQAVAVGGISWCFWPGLGSDFSIHFHPCLPNAACSKGYGRKGPYPQHFWKLICFLLGSEWSSPWFPASECHSFQGFLQACSWGSLRITMAKQQQRGNCRDGEKLNGDLKEWKYGRKAEKKTIQSWDQDPSVAGRVARMPFQKRHTKKVHFLTWPLGKTLFLWIQKCNIVLLVKIPAFLYGNTNTN